MDLGDLRLGTAHALVSESFGERLPAPEAQPAAYLQALIDGLCELSLKDPLTGLHNRRYLNAVLESEIDRVARTGEAALLLIIDIDHFKNVNDTHGHPVGDLVLQAVAHTIRACMRPMDTVARYGGEEFAVILPACQFGFGKRVAERVRKAIKATQVIVSPAVTLNVTASIGGAYTIEWIRSTTALWTDRADAQLYKAKQSGRNHACIEEPPDSTVTADEKNMLLAPLYKTSGWDDLSSNETLNHGSAH
ncbi:MAG: diguanylate cyclase [Comamonas sp. SCN 65-56]|uniref:GGDEF domain-containing protein n=1 Tax=Comamonas sp. SCN 65-56 TaxID=1660095 RepID=UPI00086BA313|nr:GGDEF domain-containing protein [Comamonas sp. SCN 65-56]ODS92338.1 MAG: diguanylate cyclase [Comamonas sp. SCN 65-56]